MKGLTRRQSTTSASTTPLPSARHAALLREFLDLPTAPFHEAAPLRFIRRFVAQRPLLTIRADRFGNLLVRYGGPGAARRTPPLVFAGHLDHPGFVSESMVSGGLLRARWQGWVRGEYFRGSAVRFFDGAGIIRGAVQRVMPAAPGADGRAGRAARSARSFGAESPPHAVLVRVPRPVPPGCVGMWDLPDARIDARGRIVARACDDLAGVAAILCMLDELCRRRARVECHALFTRAEEVGFGGALAAVQEGSAPRGSLIVAVECSKALPGVAFGGGPVLRVGDKATVFTPAATAFCQAVADDLSRSDATFRYQRKLMDGGTCESTVYCHFGYDATGICLPLLNYHNMDQGRGRIASEMVHAGDFQGLVTWFLALAQTRRRYDGTHPGLDARLAALHRKHRPELLRTRRMCQPDAAEA